MVPVWPGHERRHVSPMSTDVIQHRITIESGGRGFYDISRQVSDVVANSDIHCGTAHLFCQHTSAGLILCENSDPDVRTDLETFMSGLVSDGDPKFVHQSEGPDDMPAHIRSILSGNEMTISVTNGTLALGTWQGIYVWEHRAAPHRRSIVVTVTGSTRA